MWIRPLYTRIRHSPVMGVYMGYQKNAGINKGSRTGRCCSSQQDPKTEDRTSGVGWAEADRQWTDVGCLRPSCVVSGFNRTDMSLRPSVAEETGSGLPKDTWSFHLRYYRLWISSLNRFSLKWRFRAFRLQIVSWVGWEPLRLWTRRKKNTNKASKE